jgi:hypothetical protein
VKIHRKGEPETTFCCANGSDRKGLGVGRVAFRELAIGLALVASAATLVLAPSSGADRTASTPDARIYFITPEAGQSVSSPVTVRFGLAGMGVAPAGVERSGTGHHHLVIDADPPALDRPIPSDAHHRHFGGGQTEVSIELPPGEHTLQLVLADHLHVPHDPPVVSERISITVEDSITIEE